MINAGVWKKLPKDVQKALQEAADDTTRYTIQIADSEDEKAVKTLSENLKVLELSGAEAKAWEEAMKPVKEDFLKRTGADGEAVLKMAAEM